jgi:hypothetical protein
MQQQRFEGDQAALVAEIRSQFQSRVGDLCTTDPFCLSVEEVTALISKIQPKLLLQAFSAVHSQLLKLRDQLVFIDQDHVVRMVHNAIAKAVSSDARFQAHRSATQVHDFSVTYSEERLAKRKAKYDKAAA